MSMNPIIDLLGRKLRLGVIGGGENSFIGATHRRAAIMDDFYEIVAGVFSSNPKKSKEFGISIGLSKYRSYGDVKLMLKREKTLSDGADVIAIMTPNDTHYKYSMAALESGFSVICDKPMTNSLQEASTLHQKVIKSGLVFCLTHNYSGYPMVRQAKAMIDKGDLGDIRLVQVEYVQGGKTNQSGMDPDGKIRWKYDPKRSGVSAVMADIGTHAHHLIRFITGLEIQEVAAQTGAIVPNRVIDDYAGAMLRFEGGARGSFWITQAAAGVENSLFIRVSGEKGTLEWNQQIPLKLIFKSVDNPLSVITPNGAGILPFAAHASRIKKGHPEGFISAFANIYSDVADVIASKIADKTPNSLSQCFPNSYDGLMGMKFVDCVVHSSKKNGVWVNC